jgi:hypothetical protein
MRSASLSRTRYGMWGDGSGTRQRVLSARLFIETQYDRESMEKATYVLGWTERRKRERAQATI